MVKLRQVEVDLNDIVIGYVLRDIALKGFEQLGFAAASNTCDELDIGSSDYVDKFSKY